jgi:hypothetical protein
MTLVKNLSLIWLPNTINPKHIESMRKGKGTGNPGSGMQAVLAVFIIYPDLHSI